MPASARCVNLFLFGKRTYGGLPAQHSKSALTMRLVGRGWRWEGR